MGLALARELRAASHSVRLLERDPECGRAASAAAAGMLAPATEATEGGGFFDLCQASAALWPQWAAALGSETGVDCELESSGLLRVTSDPGGLERLAQRRRWQIAQGIPASELLGPAELKEQLPGVGDSFEGGVLYPTESHVHSHRVVDALLAWCRHQGVAVETGAEVTELRPSRTGVAVATAGGRHYQADLAFIAAGSWSGPLLNQLGLRVDIEPVRGQIVAARPEPQALEMIVFSDHGYLVPKRSGLVLVGATQETVGFSPWPTLEGVAALGAAAAAMMPVLKTAPFAYAWAGLRPRSPDGLPLLGRSPLSDRVLLATAHYRNGVLLAPLTARLLARAVTEGHDPAELADFSPGRFAAA